MADQMITIKLTVEELRLLADNFGQSFAPEHEGNADLDAISLKLTAALVRWHNRSRK